MDFVGFRWMSGGERHHAGALGPDGRAAAGGVGSRVWPGGARDCGVFVFSVGGRSLWFPMTATGPNRFPKNATTMTRP